MIETSDGGYLAAGKTVGSVSEELMDTNGWLVKVAADGTEEWKKTYSENNDYPDGLNAIIETSDGSYLAAGDKNVGELGDGDGWLMKTRTDGTTEWSTTYWGPDEGISALNAVIETANGGYLAVGRTVIHDAVSHTQGWLMKTATDGTKEWEKTNGKDQVDGLGVTEVLHDVAETGDGSYVAAGMSDSTNDIRGWLVKYEGGEFDPNDYDTDGEGTVEGDLTGVLQAVADYNSGAITFQQLLQVIAAYNGS